MSEQRRVRSSAQGFTLVEVMITLVILAFGLLTLALVQLQAMRQGSQGRHTGDGMAIALRGIPPTLLRAGSQASPML